MVSQVADQLEKSNNSSQLDLSSKDLEVFPAELLQLQIETLHSLCLDYNDLTIIPENINELVNLRYLSISGNELEEIPDSISSLKLLEELFLNENRLIQLPTTIGKLASLKKLSLIGNRLSAIPDEVSELYQLKELYLDENNLTMLSVSFDNLQELEVLELSNNKLQTLSKDIGCASRLKILNVNFNKLLSLPDSISELLALEILDVSNNKLEELPEKFASSRTIVKLFVENNNFKCLPDWCNDMPKLEEFMISDNALCKQQINDEFCENANNLRILDAGANYMESLSTKFGCLSKLESVHFGSTIPELERSNFQNGNWMPHLPDSFCELKSLVKANINENQIQHLPERFGDLISLAWLDLGQNMLRKLPASFCELRNLEFLQLSKNQLSELPEEIGNFQKLIELRLDNNLLTTIPNSLGTIKCLQALDLFHNELDELPEVIFKLTKLTRLDLDNNNFNMSTADVPKITPGVQYPERDPTLKNNWRGKSRAVHLNTDNDDIIEYGRPGCELKEDEESGGETEELTWNYQALRNAVNRGASFWRSHTNTSAARPIASDNLDDQNIEACDFNEDWIPLNDESNKHNTPVDEDVNKDPCEEDWDEEIKMNTEYNSVLLTCDERKLQESGIINDFQNTVNRYPPSKQAYSATAFYESFVYRKKNLLNTGAGNIIKETVDNTIAKDVDSLTIVEGQFDDAET